MWIKCPRKKSCGHFDTSHFGFLERSAVLPATGPGLAGRQIGAYTLVSHQVRCGVSLLMANSMATWINADQSRVARLQAGGDSATNVFNEAFEHVVKNLNVAARSMK